MVISQQLIEEIDSFVRDKSLVLRVDKAVPGLLLETWQDVVVLSVELNLILVKVVKELVGAQYLGNLDKLVGVALAVEERFLAENHGRKHGAQTPHIQAVVVLLEINKQLRTLEVSRCYANVVLGGRVVEFSQTPINKTKLYSQLVHRRLSW